jgi:hypothetical protein
LFGSIFFLTAFEKKKKKTSMLTFLFRQGAHARDDFFLVVLLSFEILERLSEVDLFFKVESIGAYRIIFKEKKNKKIIKFK